MTKAEMQKLMEHIFDQCQGVREEAQKEYAHDTSNAFGNFERLAYDLQLDRMQILWIYLKKHSDGVLAYINGHRSQREDVRGRIKDMIVYLCLLWGMVEENERPMNLNEQLNAPRPPFIPQKQSRPVNYDESIR